MFCHINWYIVTSMVREHTAFAFRVKQLKRWVHLDCLTLKVTALCFFTNINATSQHGIRIRSVLHVRCAYLFQSQWRKSFMSFTYTEHEILHNYGNSLTFADNNMEEINEDVKTY